jgi:translation initiation factor IF-3
MNRPNTPFSGGTRPPMGNRPGGSYNRQGSHRSHGPRKNERIRALEVRVIGPDGNQLGVMPTRDALDLAKRHGLDLVEISASATPPVCRILDFGKFLYEQSKKTKESVKSTTAGKVKEVKFRLHIDQHDYVTKMRHAEEFLAKGFKLKITLSMRGRELEHANLGMDLVKRAIGDLIGTGTADGEPRRAGRNIGVSLTPIAAQKRKFKFLEPDEIPQEKK